MGRPRRYLATSPRFLGELAVLTPINLEQFGSSETLEVRELAATELALYLELASIVDRPPAESVQRNELAANGDCCVHTQWPHNRRTMRSDRC